MPKMMYPIIIINLIIIFAIACCPVNKNTENLNFENIDYKNGYLTDELLSDIEDSLDRQIEMIKERAYKNYKKEVNIDWVQEEVEIYDYKWDKGNQFTVNLVSDNHPSYLYIKNENDEIVATAYCSGKKKFNPIHDIIKVENCNDLYNEVYETELINAANDNTYIYYGYIQDTDGKSFHVENQDVVSNYLQTEENASAIELSMSETLDKLRNIDEEIKDMEISVAYDCLLNTEDVKVIEYNKDSIIYNIHDSITCKFQK